MPYVSTLWLACVAESIWQIACVAGGIVWVRESFDGGAVFQKKGVGTRRLTILQRLRRQISLDYYTIPPATQAIGRKKELARERETPTSSSRAPFFPAPTSSKRMLRRLPSNPGLIRFQTNVPPAKIKPLLFMALASVWYDLLG